MLNRIKICQWD